MNTTTGLDNTSQASVVLINAFGCVTSTLLVYFFFVRFFLAAWFMPKVFKGIYTNLTIQNKRSFISHCLWLLVMILVIPAVWPFVIVFFTGRDLEGRIFNGALVSNADCLSVVYMMVIAMFIFEIIYRLSISPVSLM